MNRRVSIVGGPRAARQTPARRPSSGAPRFAQHAPRRSSMTCAHCGRTAGAGARFCGGCGTPLASRCPHCGTESPPDARFCEACGASLVGRPATDAVARKVVTIVFADLIDSTALHERLDPESVSRVRPSRRRPESWAARGPGRRAGFRITRADPLEPRQPVEPYFSRAGARPQRLTRLRSGHDRARHFAQFLAAGRGDRDRLRHDGRHQMTANSAWCWWSSARSL
jgi:hypothetical protein